MCVKEHNRERIPIVWRQLGLTGLEEGKQKTKEGREIWLIQSLGCSHSSVSAPLPLGAFILPSSSWDTAVFHLNHMLGESKSADYKSGEGALMGLSCTDAWVRSSNKHVSCRHQTSPVTQSQKQIHRLQKKGQFCCPNLPLALLSRHQSAKRGEASSWNTYLNRSEVVNCNLLMIERHCHTRRHAGVAAANRGAKNANLL